MNQIRFYGTSKDIINIKLIEILNILNDFKKSRTVFWKLLWLDGFGKVKNKSIQTIEEQLNNSNGLPIVFKDLYLFCSESIRLNNFLLIGDNNSQLVNNLSLNNYKNAKVDFVIELFDSSFWELSSSKEDFLIYSLKELANVEIINFSAIKQSCSMKSKQ